MITKYLRRFVAHEQARQAAPCVRCGHPRSVHMVAHPRVCRYVCQYGCTCRSFQS